VTVTECVRCCGEHTIGVGVEEASLEYRDYLPIEVQQVAAGAKRTGICLGSVTPPFLLTRIVTSSKRRPRGRHTRRNLAPAFEAYWCYLQGICAIVSGNYQSWKNLEWV
jgi:hypothetical protein